MFDAEPRTHPTYDLDAHLFNLSQEMWEEGGKLHVLTTRAIGQRDDSPQHFQRIIPARGTVDLASS
eukprot:3080529-Pyramimonas_sp.AAC.1